MAHTVEIVISQEPVAGDNFTFVINGSSQTFFIVDDTPNDYRILTSSFDENNYRGRILDFVLPTLDDFAEPITGDNFTFNSQVYGKDGVLIAVVLVEEEFRDSVSITSFSSNASYITGELIDGLPQNETFQDAVILSKPEGVYPMHNDSWISYRYSLEDLTAVTGRGVTSRVAFVDEGGTQLANTTNFPVYADNDEIFYFNLKDAVLMYIRKKGYQDVNFFEEGFVRKNENIVYDFKVRVSVLTEGINGTFNSDEEDIDFRFKDALFQFGEIIVSNPFQLLSEAKSERDFDLIYFEGFPFSFDIQEAGQNNLSLKHKGTGFESKEINVEGGSYRFNIDNTSGDNWTNSGFLPLKRNINKIELLNFETKESYLNININKKEVSNGVYLKWWNGKGGFSYWLFDKFFEEEITTRSKDSLQRNDFANIGDFKGGFVSGGKTASKTNVITTKTDKTGANQLRSLFYSPYVEMYSSQKAEVKGEFFQVGIKANFKLPNKRNVFEYVIEIEMPEFLTAKI